uniref:PIN domain-containing protein n=2 Tax=Parascaris univalens TaxID=6257 RepID=A0A915AJ71_PARUN
MEVDEGIHISKETSDEDDEEPMEIEEGNIVDRAGTSQKLRNLRRSTRSTPFKDGSVIVVLDTSVLLEAPTIIKKCTDVEFNVVIPYKVVEELDHFKNSESSCNQAHATTAVSVMHNLLTLHSDHFIFESSFESSSRLDGLACWNNDDYVLKCALTYLTKYAPLVRVLLATEDKNLTLKAAANRVRAVNAEQLDVLIDQKKGRNYEHSDEHEITESNDNGREDSKVGENKDVEALPDFSFTIPPSTNVPVDIPEVLKCFGSSVTSMQSVFAVKRRELSEGMLQFLDYCDAIVAEICAKRMKSENDAVVTAHSRDLLSAFGNTRRFKIGSIAEMVNKVEYMTSVYLNEEVIFDVEALSDEYPTVCMEAGKRLGVLQTQLW